MSLEELIDYCKTLFSDRKFIDLVAKFSIEETDKDKIEGNNEEKNEMENSYTIYISPDKVTLLIEVLE